MRGALGVRHPEFVQACDQLAFTYESVAHHYLQDAWSMGHMWERWGGPNPGDFGGASDWRPRALLIALTSGLIHGAKGVVQSKLPSWLPPGSVDALDPMCAPLDPAQNNYGEPVWATLPPPTYEYAADRSLYTAVGDLYLDLLRSDYGVQYGRMIDCGAASLNQLAAQAGIGSLGSTPGSAPGSCQFQPGVFRSTGHERDDVPRRGLGHGDHADPAHRSAGDRSHRVGLPPAYRAGRKARQSQHADAAHRSRAAGDSGFLAAKLEGHPEQRPG